MMNVGEKEGQAVLCDYTGEIITNDLIRAEAVIVLVGNTTFRVRKMSCVVLSWSVHFDKFSKSGPVKHFGTDGSLLHLALPILPAFPCPWSASDR